MNRVQHSLGTLFYRKTTVPLIIIITSSAALSAIAYYYSMSISDTIAEIASKDISSNAAGQARDLSLILSNGVDSTTTNLQILSNSPAVQNFDYDSRLLFDVSQNSTSQLTHFYLWLDAEGRVEWVTNDGLGNENHQGLDRSYREYFSVPHSTLKPFFSDVIKTSDNVARLYIAYPVIDKRQTALAHSDNISQFKGVVVAAIGVDSIGNMMRQSSPSDLQRNNLLLLDNNATIIFSRDSWLIDKNIIQDQDDIIRNGFADKTLLSQFVQAHENTATGKPFDIDFTSSSGDHITLASEPVLVNGQRLWTVSVVAPHTLTTDVRLLFDQQNIFSTMMVIVVGALAFGIAFFVLSSNRRLGSIVDSRTSELKHANALLKESNKRLGALNEELFSTNEKLLVNDKMQKEFINIASHEMKTPTQAILFHSDIVKRKPEKAVQSIEAIVRNAERLQKLTNNILDVTRIESQTLKISKEQMNLKDVIAAALGDLKSQDSTINFVYDEKDIVLQADKTRIAQVISNLLTNAIEFTKQGGIWISTEVSSNEKHVTVSITDSGPGIDPEIMPRLFTKFATKSDKGTGLGLFIAKSIIEAHGGRIWVENGQKGSGATFSFTLPLSDT